MSLQNDDDDYNDDVCNFPELETEGSTPLVPKSVIKLDPS